MTRFVVCGDAFVALGDHPALLLGTHKHFIYALVELGIADKVFIRPGCQNGCLVQKIFKVGTGKARSYSCNCLKVYVGRHGLVARMYLEDLLPALDVGKIDVYLSVEASGTHQCGVEDVGAVSCRHHNYALVRFKAVHLDEYLVERLFALVVAAAESCASVPSHRIDFVDEDYAGLVLLCHLKQVAHTRGAYADIHFNEVGTGDRKERHARFACHGLGKQRFTRSGRTYQKHALGYSCAQIGKLFGLL